MSVVLFFVGFLATGIVGVKTLGSYENLPSERIGAEAFLFLLCIGASSLSVLSYLQGSRGFHCYPGKIASLIGGVVAAGIFCAAAGTMIYLGLSFAFSVTLTLALPSLLAFVWPLLTAKVRNA
jgi:hypothetical protein